MKSRLTQLGGLIGTRDVVLTLGRTLTEPKLDFDDHGRAFAATALGLLGCKEDIRAPSRISEDTGYTSQRGVLSRVLGRL